MAIRPLNSILPGDNPQGPYGPLDPNGMGPVRPKFPTPAGPINKGVPPGPMGPIQTGGTDPIFRNGSQRGGPLSGSPIPQVPLPPPTNIPGIPQNPNQTFAGAAQGYQATAQADDGGNGTTTGGSPPASSSAWNGDYSQFKGKTMQDLMDMGVYGGFGQLNPAYSGFDINKFYDAGGVNPNGTPTYTWDQQEHDQYGNGSIPGGSPPPPPAATGTPPPNGDAGNGTLGTNPLATQPPPVTPNPSTVGIPSLNTIQSGVNPQQTGLQPNPTQSSNPSSGSGYTGASGGYGQTSPGSIRTTSGTSAGNPMGGGRGVPNLPDIAGGQSQTGTRGNSSYSSDINWAQHYADNGNTDITGQTKSDAVSGTSSGQRQLSPEEMNAIHDNIGGNNHQYDGSALHIPTDSTGNYTQDAYESDGQTLKPQYSFRDSNGNLKDEWKSKFNIGGVQYEPVDTHNGVLDQGAVTYDPELGLITRQGNNRPPPSGGFSDVLPWLMMAGAGLGVAGGIAGGAGLSTAADPYAVDVTANGVAGGSTGAPSSGYWGMTADAGNTATDAVIDVGAASQAPAPVTDLSVNAAAGTAGGTSMIPPGVSSALSTGRTLMSGASLANGLFNNSSGSHPSASGNTSGNTGFNPLDVIPPIVNGINDNRNVQDYNRGINDYYNRGDYNSAYRPGQLGQLNNLLFNPDDALKSPGYQAVRDRAMTDLTRRENARGMGMSGNEMGDLTKLGSELDYKQINSERDQFRLAANQGDPASLARAGMMSQAFGAQLRGQRNFDNSNAFQRFLGTSTGHTVSDWLNGVTRGANGEIPWQDAPPEVRDALDTAARNAGMRTDEFVNNYQPPMPDINIGGGDVSGEGIPDETWNWFFGG